ncbi:hypothetical protein EKH55_0426 [Sinorhizobium alkalisoli]|nr:hypothetical protein EKH55_0426 [Sinorhizobium alkalisoli]
MLNGHCPFSRIRRTRERGIPALRRRGGGRECQLSALQGKNALSI